MPPVLGLGPAYGFSPIPVDADGTRTPFIPDRYAIGCPIRSWHLSGY
jgi:hypothetical protein